MVALTLCEAARSPFDIICGALASVCVWGARVRQQRAIMQAETGRAAQPAARDAVQCFCLHPCHHARFINISDRIASNLTTEEKPIG